MVMNAADALGYMEDVAIINGHMAAEDARRRANDMETMGAVATAMQLLERDMRYAALRQDRNHNVVHAKALQSTLECLIQDLASATGRPVAQVATQYNVVRTQKYNALCNEGMEKGWFDRDPRLSMSEKVKAWYVPRLDPAHGY